ncbi:MAG: hypothetical protein GQ565_00495 [Candidatus Aegiribacteria sp.]|nr:hypothetical protein [Candidatus Aegiribacteria sp.]
MNERIDRKAISIGSFKELEKQNIQFWAIAGAAEKFKTITYLRECFYGHEATTGRLQRVYRVFKRS